MKTIEYSYDRILRLETMLEMVKASKQKFEEFNGDTAICLVKFCDKLLEGIEVLDEA